jgi:hypothetical protein
MRDTITIEDVPKSEIVIFHGVPGRPLSAIVHAVLARISTMRPDRALRITGITSESTTNCIRTACRRRWPGMRIARDGNTIIVVPPEDVQS